MMTLTPKKAASRPILSIASVMMFLVFLAGCDSGEWTILEGDPAAGDPTSLVFAFQRQADPSAIGPAAAEVAEFLSAELGIPVRHEIPGSYAMSVQGLVSGQVDVAYVSAIPFLLARRDANARILLAEVRADGQGVERTDYDSVFVVAQDSPLRSIDDVVARASELRVAFTSTTSTSGYIFPFARLVREGLLSPGQDVREAFDQVIFAGSYTLALQQVLDGRADVAAVSFYTVEGPTRNVYLPENEQRRLRVLDRTPRVPTHLISVRGGISPEFQERIADALIKLVDQHPELLAKVYGATRLERVDQDHVRAAEEAVEFVQVDLGGLVR